MRSLRQFNWDDLALFLQVAESGSLSAAARRSGLGQATVSRRMAELEQQIGEALFLRHNTGIVLSPCAEALLPAVQGMAEWAHVANLKVQKLGHLASGKVRVAAPPGIAAELVVPLAAELRQQHPALQLEVLAGIEVLNLQRGEADISLRIKPPADPDLLLLASVKCPVRAYCAPSYAARLGPAPDLASLDWICWAPPYDDLIVNQELARQIPNFKPAFSSDDYLVQFQACQQGLGVMALAKAAHRFSVLHTLHELDLDLGPEASGELHLVCHKRQRDLPKVALVLAALQAEFAALQST